MSLDFTFPLSEEINKELSNVEIILAADGESSKSHIWRGLIIILAVIYDDDVTEAFVDTLVRIFQDKKSRSVYVALEKRIVFTLDDLNAVAPCYEHFLRCLHRLREINVKTEEISIDFPQYFQYEKIKELVLWKIFN